MTWLKKLGATWRTIVGRDALDRDVSDEVRAYVELLTDEGTARGLSPEEARRRALVAVEGTTQVREAVRESRPGAWVAHAQQDLLYGARVLRRSPAFTASAVVTLALAIGATIAITRVLDTVVRAPLPFPDSSRLIAVSGHGYVGEYLQFRERARTFEATSYRAVAPMTLTGSGEPVRLETVVVTIDFLDVLGARPALGSAFQPADGKVGAAPAVMISDRLWRQRFLSDARVVGRTVVLNGVTREVRGVMPATFGFPSAAVDIWAVARIDTANRVAIWSTTGGILGRLRPGHSIEDARAEVGTLGPSFRELFPWRMPEGYGANAEVRTLKEELVGEHDLTLLVAAGAVSFVMVMACLNVGILLMGRSMARQVELSTRAALGATRGRLARQVMVECALLAAIGGGAGIALAAGGLSTLVAVLPADIPRLHEVTPGLFVILAGGALSLLAALMIGAVPVWRAARPVVSPTPGVRHPGQDRLGRRTTRALVALEVALAVVLVVGAGLLVRTVAQLMRVDPGFTSASTISATLAPSLTRYAQPEPRREFLARVLDRVQSLTFVQSAALTDQLPFSGAPFGSVFIVQGRPDPATTGQWPWADVRSVVSDAFFETLQIPLRAGRAFTALDAAGGEQVAMVNEALARQYWPAGGALGARIRFPDMTVDRWITITGVVADHKWERMSEETKGAMYLPLAQSAPATVRLVARVSDVDATAAGAAIRDAVTSIDPDTPVDTLVSLDGLVRQSASASRFLAALFSAFGLVGLLLGALGIFGVTSDAVARTRHEIAVRLAIGAEPASIVRLVVGQSLMLALAGVAAGLAVAWFGSAALAGALYQTSATDPLTYALVAIGLAVVAALSCYLPARRASRISPLDSLRES